MKTFLRYANTPVLALLMLAAFVALAHESIKHEQQGYTKAQRAAFDHLVASTRMTKQQRAISEIWGISIEEASKPVNLFNE